MKIFQALFSGPVAKAYRQDLTERMQASNDELDNATRRLLHVAGRAINDGKQDIFTEFSILLNHTHDRLISTEGSRVYKLVLSFAGVSFVTFAMLLWSTVITVGVMIGTPPDEFLFSNIITGLSVIMILFAIPLIRILTVPSRTVWYGSAFIATVAIGGYIWAGEYIQ